MNEKRKKKNIKKTPDELEPINTENENSVEADSAELKIQDNEAVNDSINEETNDVFENLPKEDIENNNQNPGVEENNVIKKTFFNRLFRRNKNIIDADIDFSETESDQEETGEEQTEVMSETNNIDKNKQSDQITDMEESANEQSDINDSDEIYLAADNLIKKPDRRTRRKLRKEARKKKKLKNNSGEPDIEDNISEKDNSELSEISESKEEIENIDDSMQETEPKLKKRGWLGRIKKPKNISENEDLENSTDDNIDNEDNNNGNKQVTLNNITASTALDHIESEIENETNPGSFDQNVSTVNKQTNQPLTQEGNLQNDISVDKVPKASFSIKYKLAILISLVTILVIGILSSFFIYNQKEVMIDNMEQKGKIMASQLAKSVLELMIQPDFYEESAREELIAFNIVPIFSESAQEKDIVYIKLYDKYNKYVHSAGSEDKNIKTVPSFSLPLKNSEGKINSQFILIDEESKLNKTIFHKILGLKNNFFNVAFPVMPLNAKKNIGFIHVGLSQTGSNQKIVSMFQTALIIAAAVLIIGFFMAMGAAFLFTKPITKVKDALVKVSKGDLEQYITHNANDEIGILTYNFNKMTDGLREKEKMRDRFGKAVSEEIVEVMMSGELELGGEDKHVTMLFSDIRSFTKLSGNLTPAEVLEMLNEYFTIMENIVKRNMGVIDKYVGDEIMAIFGAVGENQDSEENACRSAVEMLIELDILNKKRTSQNKIPIRIGIGINSGQVTAGMLGSTNRMNYTVIGDTVNMASRLCDAGGSHGFAPCIIAEDTYQAVKDMTMVRSGPMIAVKGKEHPIPIYELIGILNRVKSNALKLGKELHQTEKQRKYERVSVADISSMSFRNLNSNTITSIDKIIDISCDGIKFVTEEAIDSDQYIEVKIKIYDYMMRLIVQVKHSTEQESGDYNVGTQFITVSAFDLQVLNHYIEKSIKETQEV